MLRMIENVFIGCKTIRNDLEELKCHFIEYESSQVGISRLVNGQDILVKDQSPHIPRPLKIIGVNGLFEI